MTALLTVAVKGLVVLGAAALVARVLRGASASTRHGLWAVAFAALALLPVLEATGPRWPVGVWPAAEPDVDVVYDYAEGGIVVGDGHIYGMDGMELHHEFSLETSDHTEHDSYLMSEDGYGIEIEHSYDTETSVSSALAFADEWPTTHWSPSALMRTASRAGGWLAALWGAGALAVALGWLAALLAARRVVVGARPEADDEWAVQAERARRLVGLPAPVPLLRSDALDVPVAWGWGRGAVVLPTSADAWDDDQREAVLLHEMAHLARRDAWSQSVAQVALALHWFNPLAWWGYRRFLDAREHACDDAVLRNGARPSTYAEHLVSVARAVRRDRLALAGLAPMARTAPVQARVVSILDPARVRGRMGRVSGAALVLLAAGVLAPLAALQPVAQTPPAPAAPLPDWTAVADTLDELYRVEPAPEPHLDVWAEVEDAILESAEAIDEVAQEMETTEHSARAAEVHVGEVEPLRPGVDPDVVDGVSAEIRSAIDGDIENARADIRRAIRELERLDGPAARLRIDALRQAEWGLAQIDRQALRENARAEARRALDRVRQRPAPSVAEPPAPPAPPRPHAPAAAPADGGRR